MTILITGGAGFIGTNIALLAKKQNHKVVVFDSLIRRGVSENVDVLKKNRVIFTQGDVRSYSDFKKIKKPVDAIIHLAANPGIPWSIKDPLYDFDVNAKGTLHVLEFSKENGKIPVIFASTNKIYSEEINLIPYREEKTRFIWDFKNIKRKRLRKAILYGVSKKGINEYFPMDASGLFPHSPYGVSKAAADLYCQEYFHIFDIPVVINRMSCIYGLYQKGVEDQGWIDWFVRAKVQNHPLNIYGNGKQVRDALFADDLTALYLLQIKNIKRVKGMVFNIGGGIQNTTSLLEVIDFLNNKKGKKLELRFKSWRPADQKIYISDISKIKTVLGWEPKVSVSEGLKEMWNAINSDLN